jgi:cell division inhibitor SepF
MGEGFFNKFKVLIGIEEVDLDELDDVEPMAIERKPIETRSSFIAPRNEAKEYRDNKDSKVLPMANKNTSANQFKMLVIEPKSFDECPKLVDSLKAKKPVIINLEKVESDIARKIFDFMSGATYALSGNVQKVANNIFVFAPENVDITAQLDHKGGSFSEDIKNPWR